MFVFLIELELNLTQIFLVTKKIEQINGSLINLHANNMANSVVGAATSDSIFRPLKRILRRPTPLAAAWIRTEVPVRLPQSFRDLFQSFHCKV